MKKLLLPFFLLSVFYCAAQDQRIWATYYGGEGNADYGFTVATDTHGNVYLGGSTTSVTGISFNGFQNIIGGSADAFLVKFDSSGSRIWATYYGDSGGDMCYDIAIDMIGNIYMAGRTSSNTQIALNGFQSVMGGAYDAFLVKFDSNGNRLWATYYGGNDPDIGYGVTTDSAGNVYLTGETASSSEIAGGGFQNSYGGGYRDAFIAKFDSSGNRIWATYYGGADSDYGFSIVTDANENVYMAGKTNSHSGISSGGFQNNYGGGDKDAFLVKFDSSGNRLWATYYGGTGDENEVSAAIDLSGNVYLAGETESSTGIASLGFQNTIGGMQDIFLVKFNSIGNRLWATYYGGEGNEEGERLNVVTDEARNIYLAADTYSPNGIAFEGFQNNLNGLENEFVVKLDSNCVQLCATYYGQTHDESACLAIDKFGNVYLGGYTGSISGMASGGFQNLYGGGNYDAYLVKFSTCTNMVVAITSSVNPLCHEQCTGSASVSPVYGTPPYSYSWSTLETTQSISNLCEGTYSVTVTDSMGNSATYDISINQPAPLTLDIISYIYCPNDLATASALATGGTNSYTYLWNTIPQQTTQSATELDTGTYSVTVTDANGCFVSDSISISDSLNFSISVIQSADTLYATPAPNYQWYLNDTLISGATNQQYIITESGNYYVITSSDSCTFTSNVIETSCLCVGIDENELAKQISLYPNPTSGNIVVKSDLITKNTVLSVFNSLGQQVFVPLLQQEENRVTLYTTHLVAGVYSLMLNNSTQQVSKRFVKE